MRWGGYAGVDFDADFGVGGEGESFAGVGEKIFDLLGRKIGGGATAPMELRDLALTGDTFADVVNFVFQNAEIWRRDALVFLDDDVAGAEKAQAFAERQGHIQRKGGARLRWPVPWRLRTLSGQKSRSKRARSDSSCSEGRDGCSGRRISR